MAFEFLVDSLDGIPEDQHEHYVEKDGRFEIQVKGMKTQGDVDRVTLALKKERTNHGKAKERLQTFGEHTPDTLDKLTSDLEEAQLRLDEKGTDGGPSDEAIDKLVETRVLSRVRPLERKLKTLGDEVDTLTGENKGLVGEKRSASILKSVLDAATGKDIAVTSDALADVELWAKHVFEVTDDGDVVSRDVTGISPGLAPKDVFADMKASGTRRHWFGATTGAGASGGSGGDSGTNPFHKDTRNLTKIGQMVQADPKRAQRLAKAAGAEDLLPANMRSTN